MALYTKSAQPPKSKDDGIRICIMRKPGSTVQWDIWMPTLAPSLALLDAYHAQIIDWDEFAHQFEQEVILGMREYLKVLVDISKHRTVTILCWEDTPEKCHRRLIAQACQQLDPELIVVIK